MQALRDSTLYHSWKYWRELYLMVCLEMFGNLTWQVLFWVRYSQNNLFATLQRKSLKYISAVIQVKASPHWNGLHTSSLSVD